MGWVLTSVASSVSTSGSGASDADNSEKISSKTPLSHQRRQRLSRVLWGPSAAGASTQRTPFCMTGMMLLNTFLSSTRFPPCSLGNKGRMRSTCSALSQNNWAITDLPTGALLGGLSLVRGSFPTLWVLTLACIFMIFCWCSSIVLKELIIQLLGVDQGRAHLQPLHIVG